MTNFVQGSKNNQNEDHKYEAEHQNMVDNEDNVPITIGHSTFPIETREYRESTHIYETSILIFNQMLSIVTDI